MQLVDQSGQRITSAIQWVFWGILNLITLKKVDKIRAQVKNAKIAYKEASSQNRI